jgi:CheY-like chemotaxis protein
MKKSKGSVIIVEDDKLLSLVQGRIVEKLGYTLLAKVSSGREAIQKMQELDPDVMMMDISIKGDLDGVETARKIREISDVPVIFLSGSADHEQVERATSLSNADYLVKPIKADDLIEPLKKAVKKSPKRLTLTRQSA